MLVSGTEALPSSTNSGILELVEVVLNRVNFNQTQKMKEAPIYWRFHTLVLQQSEIRDVSSYAIYCFDFGIIISTAMIFS